MKLRVFWVLLLLLQPLRLTAQQQLLEWTEYPTQYLTILYPTGNPAAAEEYAAFADSIYAEVTSQIGYRPAPPLALRIFPTQATYQQTNPLAQQVEGIIAHAHTGRREISVSWERQPGQSDEDIRNIVRHELVHIIAADLSQGRLSTMWHEGIAQYVETATPHQERKIELLQALLEKDRLYAWSRLDSGRTMYENPAVGYPQSWSMVSFLVQRNGMAPFVEFLQASANTETYRSALEQTYGVSPETLEQEWREQLPAWLADGWRRPAPTAVDPYGIAASLSAGRYDEAVAAAEAALKLTTDLAQTETLNQQLALARQGQQADAALEESHTALLEGDYERADQLLEFARTQYAPLNRTDVTPLLDAYAARVAEGREAQALLEQARSEIRGLRWMSAYQHLDTASRIFSRLDDRNGLAAVQLLHATLKQRTQVVALVVLALVVLGLAWNIDRRRAARRRSLPLG